MSLPRARDDTCTKILTAIVFSRDTYRFNELHRYLNEKFFKISKVTLSKHLKHLVESELLYRDEKDKQYVTYRFYDEKWKHLDKFVETQKALQKLFEKEEKDFDSYSISTQISGVFVSLIRRDLLILRNEILMVIDPDNRYEYSMKILVLHNVWNGLRYLLLRKCLENDADYRNEVLNEINEIADFITDNMISKDKIKENETIFKSLFS